MNIITKKMDEVHIAEQNVRLHPQRQIEELKRSYEKFGQYRPLVVTAEGEILVGNGLYEALKLAGAKTVDVIVLPADVTEEYKKKLMLADNKIFSLGSDNINNIDKILSELDEFDIPGYDDSVLKEMYKSLDDIKININDVSGMGVIPQEKIDQISKVEEARKENPDVDVPKNKDSKTSAYEAEPIDEKTDVSRYVNCPHCGAKIWI